MLFLENLDFISQDGGKTAKCLYQDFSVYTYNFGRGQCFIETWSKKDDTNLGFIASIRENHESGETGFLQTHDIG